MESILREHLRDPSAALSDMRVQPLGDVQSAGFSHNNLLFRAQVAWAAEEGTPKGCAEWIVKRWQRGGLSEDWPALTNPLEALAWRHGLLTRQGLPTNIVVPFIGAEIAPGGGSAWVVMEDVATELSQFDRAHPLPPAEAVVRVRHILDGLARLHVLWEQPQRQEKLARCPWLLGWERMVWRNVSTHAISLGRDPVDAARGVEVTEVRRKNVQAFLEWLPRGDRSLWEQLMVYSTEITPKQCGS